MSPSIRIPHPPQLVPRKPEPQPEEPPFPACRLPASGPRVRSTYAALRCARCVGAYQKGTYLPRHLAQAELNEIRNLSPPSPSFLCPPTPSRRPTLSSPPTFLFLPYELYELPSEKLRVRKAQIHGQHPKSRRRYAQQYPSSRSNTSTAPFRPDAACRRFVLVDQSSNEPSRRGWQSPAQLHFKLSSWPSRPPGSSWPATTSWSHQSHEPGPRSQSNSSFANGRRPSSHQHRRSSCWLSS